jgi:glycosyltransferase involved in cell wall biosynthesis
MLYDQNKNKIIPEISVVVLAYKAGETIKEFTADLMQLMQNHFGRNYELILVGNYHQDSQDLTPAVVKQIANAHDNIIAVAELKQGMMGWDMRSGLRAACGKTIAVIDGDNQMPIDDLIRVYNQLKNQNADLAKTYRIHRGDQTWRKIISFIYNIIFKILFPGLNSRDINSKPKIMTRQAYEKLDLSSNDWFIDAEIMIQARRHNFKIGEVATSFWDLAGKRRSFVKPGAILEFIKNLIYYRSREYRFKKKKI